MAAFLTLTNFIVNLEAIQMIKISPDPLTVLIFWASGYEETMLQGEDAVRFIDAVDKYSIDGFNNSILHDWMQLAWNSFDSWVYAVELLVEAIEKSNMVQALTWYVNAQFLMLNSGGINCGMT